MMEQGTVCQLRKACNFLQNIISNPTYKKIIEDKAVGVTMLNLNVPIVSALAIPQLPIDMQEQFIEFMHQTDKLKFEVKQALEKLETLKKAFFDFCNCLCWLYIRHLYAHLSFAFNKCLVG